MSSTHFRPGDHVTLTYDRAVPKRTELVVPVTVIQDSPESTMVTIAAGTLIQARVLEDGTPVPRDIPYAEMARLPLILGDRFWTATNVLVIWKPEWQWDVRLYRDAGTGEFRCWYLNIQDPVRRSPSGFTSTDHFLDIVVHPDRSWEWKDEAELVDATELGMYTAAEAEGIRQAGEAALQMVTAWAWPFNAGPESFQPDAGWHIPTFP